MPLRPIKLFSKAIRVFQSFSGPPLQIHPNAWLNCSNSSRPAAQVCRQIPHSPSPLPATRLPRQASEFPLFTSAAAATATFAWSSSAMCSTSVTPTIPACQRAYSADRPRSRVYHSSTGSGRDFSMRTMPTVMAIPTVLFTFAFMRAKSTRLTNPTSPSLMKSTGIKTSLMDTSRMMDRSH